MGRRQQSESIEVAFDMELGYLMNRFDVVVGAIARKVSHSLSSCNPSKARKSPVVKRLMSLLDQQHIGQPSL